MDTVMERQGRKQRLQLLLIVVEPAGCNLERLGFAASAHAIDQPMLLIDASRPPAGHFVAQRFWLTNPLKRKSARLANKFIYPLRYLGIVDLPIGVVVPPAIGP